jgi:hypothetical protein
MLINKSICIYPNHKCHLFVFLVIRYYLYYWSEVRTFYETQLCCFNCLNNSLKDNKVSLFLLSLTFWLWFCLWKQIPLEQDHESWIDLHCSLFSQYIYVHVFQNCLQKWWTILFSLKDVQVHLRYLGLKWIRIALKIFNYTV